MASQISMVTAEYKVRAITGDEFIVIYTRGSAMVKACLPLFLRMFNSSKDEWVAGKQEDSKGGREEEARVIQVCVHDLFLVYHICHADVECEDFKNFLGGGKVKFVSALLE